MQLTQLEATVQRELVRNCGASSRFLLAVSGGVDSVALLSLCRDIAKRGGGLHFEVAHVDHAVRAQSTDDAMHVRSLAQKLFWRFHMTRLGACPDSENFENWARLRRYQFLEQVRTEQGLDFIVTAHHADDVTETFLMRLLSNKDPRGIAVFDADRKIVRPLLSCARAELEAYLRHTDLEAVHDSSNDDTTYLRNRVRHELLPFIKEKFGEASVRSLRQRAECAAADLEAIAELSKQAIVKLGQLEWGADEWRETLNRQLNSLPDGLKWRFVDDVLLPLIGFRIGMVHSRRALEVLSGARRAAELPGGWCLELQSGVLKLSGAAMPLSS